MRSRWEPSDGGVSFALPTLTRVVKWLLVANVTSFLFFELLGGWSWSSGSIDIALGQVLRWLELAPERWKEDFPLVPLWQLVSYGFLHGDVWHLLNNMLFLYFLGTMLEEEIGARRFMVFYSLALTLAGLAQLLFGLSLGHATPVIGASGAVLAVACAMATLRPSTRIILFIIPMTLRTLVLLFVALDVLRLVRELKGNPTGVASCAHLSGAALGFLAVRRGWIWRDPLAELDSWRERRAEDQQASDEERLDSLLAKINREGLRSLSARERAFLKRVSHRR